jgi:hypothetical protein
MGYHRIIGWRCLYGNTIIGDGMKLFVLMPPALHNTDFTTSFSSYDKEQKKKINKVVTYEGAYDYFISQQLVPLAIHHPIIVNETTTDRYGETQGKSKWVMPTLGCIQSYDKGQGKWLIPIFKTVDEFLESPMGVWINKRFTNSKGEKKLDWINKWQEQIKRCNEGGLTHFCVAIPITLRGKGEREEVISTLRNNPYKDEVAETLATTGIKKSSARQEIGRFYRTEYPMFIVPTGIDKTPSYYSEGGRFFNIAPMKQDGKKSPYLEEYAKNMGYELAKPVVVSKKPKMKKLTQAEQTLAPREWFMQQYTSLQDSVFNLRHEGFNKANEEYRLERKGGNTNYLLFATHTYSNTKGISELLSVNELGRQFNELLSHILIQYVNPNQSSQLPTDFEGYINQYLPSFPAKYPLWPLDKVNFKTLNELDSGRVLELDEQPYETLVKKHTYASTSLPPSLLLLSLESHYRHPTLIKNFGDALSKDYIQQFIKEGAKNLVEDDSLNQYHCYFWDEDRMSIGLMNHGFLNFINPTVWDMN